MKYTIILHDGVKYPFEASHHDFIKERMTDGGVFELAGELIRGSDIKRVVKGADTGQYGPHTPSNPLLSIASEVFSTKKYDDFFWKRVIDRNKDREAKGMCYYYQAAVVWARQQNGHADVPELFAFLDSELEEATRRNLPDAPNNKPDSSAQRAFFASDEGKGYAAKWGYLDRHL